MTKCIGTHSHLLSSGLDTAFTPASQTQSSLNLNPSSHLKPSKARQVCWTNSSVIIHRICRHQQKKQILSNPAKNSTKPFKIVRVLPDVPHVLKLRP